MLKTVTLKISVFRIQQTSHSYPLLYFRINHINRWGSYLMDIVEVPI